MLAACLAGFLFLGSTPALAAGCPQFLIANGYADLCSPTAWMAFEHQNHENNRIFKRRHHQAEGDQPGHPPRTKIRLRHASKK